MAPRAQWNGYLKLSLVSCPISLYPAISPAERISFRQVNRETGNRLRQQLVDSVTGAVVESHNKGRGYEVGDNQFLVIPDEELAAAQQEARTRPFTPNPAASAVPAAPLASPPPAPSAEQPSRRGPALKLVEPLPAEDVEDARPAAAPPAALRPILENTHTIELDRFIAREEVDPRYYLAPYYVVPREEVGEETFAVIQQAMARLGLVGMGRVVLANRERPIIIEPM